LAGAPAPSREIKNVLPPAENDDFNTFKAQDTSFDF
jgi:hypothetical protein